MTVVQWGRRHLQPLRVLAAVDPICPLSFLGVRLFKQALETSPYTATNSDQRVFRPYWVIQPYQIDAKLPSDVSVPKRKVYSSALFKKGGFTREIENNLIEDGKKCGINFNFDGLIRNSLVDFKLLLRLRDRVDSRAAMDLLEAFFSHHLENAGDTGQPDQLGKLAHKHKAFRGHNFDLFVHGDAYQTKLLKMLVQVPKARIDRSPTFYINCARTARGNAWRAFRGVSSVEKIVAGIEDMKNNFEVKVQKKGRKKREKKEKQAAEAAETAEDSKDSKEGEPLNDANAR